MQYLAAIMGFARQAWEGDIANLSPALGSLL